MIVLDTSALIRFFTADDKIKAQKVKILLESKEELLLTEAVLLELTFTLLKFYKLPKSQILEIIKYLLSHPNIKVNSEIRKAAEIYEEKNISITDCLVLAYGDGKKIASFDDKLLKAEGIKSAFKK